MSLKTTVPPDHGGLSVQEFENIFKEYWKDVFKICHYYTRDDQTAADLTQNVFIVTWQKRSFLKDQGIIKHYLLRAAKLEALNFNRQQKMRGQKTELFYAQNNSAAGFNFTEHDVLQREADQLLKEYVAKLPVKSQTVFKMSVYEGLDNEAIATQMDMGRKSVEYHLYKAIRFIKAKII